MSTTELRACIVSALEPYASRIGLFGSVARGDDGPDSDVDVLVRLRPPEARPSLGLRWFGIEADLAEQLGRRVELVTEEALSPRLRPHVERDLVVLYED